MNAAKDTESSPDAGWGSLDKRIIDTDCSSPKAGWDSLGKTTWCTLEAALDLLDQIPDSASSAGTTHTFESDDEDLLNEHLLADLQFRLSAC